MSTQAGIMHQTTEAPATDDTRAKLEAMSDEDLLALSVQPGRIGARAFIILSERSMAKRDRGAFSLR